MEQKSGYAQGLGCILKLQEQYFRVCLKDFNKHNQENDMKTDDDIDLIAILSNN